MQRIVQVHTIYIENGPQLLPETDYSVQTMDGELQPPPEAKALPDAPTDGITQLRYLQESSLLASTSWDGSVRVHDTAKRQAVLSHSMGCGPLLSLCVTKDVLYVGGLDGSIRSFRIDSSQVELVGQHRGTEKVACSGLGLVASRWLVSVSWGGQCCVWDVLKEQEDRQGPVSTIELPGKAFCMDLCRNRVLVGCAARRVCVIEVSPESGQAELVLDRESTLKFQTRCVRLFPGGAGLAIGCIEGRVAVEYLDELGVPAPGKKYAFKCHRVNDLVYPVNCIEFHPIQGTFVTGGCDGTVGTSFSRGALPFCSGKDCDGISHSLFTVSWDGLNKKKIATLPHFPTSIAALAYNQDGSELAIASSYTFEEGEREHPRDEIYIREMLESEVMPKRKE